MSNPTQLVRAGALALSLCAMSTAHATNGYFAHGYGVKAQGAAGVGIALPQDALAAASNPAGSAAVGDRLDFGLTVFAPRRGARIVGNAFGPDASYSGDGKKTFPIPDFGYTTQLGPTLAAGIALYGNGGLNTDYDDNPFGRFGASGRAGVNLEQLFITPSIAWKASDTQTLGAALNIAYQRFSAQGIGLFGGFSSAPANVSNLGVDSSTGVGVRLGWLGRFGPRWRIGATWASTISGRFDQYKGLFANQGEFDIPENYGVGVAFAATPEWTVAGDVQTIRYSKVAAVGNSAAALFAGQPLGSTDGPGFGWDDVTVLKLASSYRANSHLLLRAGFSVADQAVPEGETFFNILAPGVVRRHLTLGATWTTASGAELSGFLAHAFGETVDGSRSIPPGQPPAGLGGGNSNVSLRQNIIGIAYGWNF